MREMVTSVLVIKRAKLQKAENEHNEQNIPETSLPGTTGLQSIAKPSVLCPLNLIIGERFWIALGPLFVSASDSAKLFKAELKSQTCVLYRVYDEPQIYIFYRRNNNKVAETLQAMDPNQKEAHFIGGKFIIHVLD